LSYIRAGEWRVLIIDPKEIKGISKHNVRRTMPDVGIEDLADNLKATGINIIPIGLNQNMEVVFGGRRYRAALKAGLPRVFCIQKDMSEMEERVYSLLENVMRLDLHPKDKYLWALEMRKQGLTVTEISKLLGIHRTTIHEWLKWDAVPPVIKETEAEQVYRDISQRKRKQLRRTLLKPQFQRDQEKAIELTKLAEKAELRVLEEIDKEASKGLEPDVKLWSEIVEHKERFSFHQLRIPVSLEKRLIKVFRYMGKGFQDGIISLLEEMVEIKERELGIVPAV